MDKALYAFADWMEDAAHRVRDVGAWFVMQDPVTKEMALYFAIVGLAACLSWTVRQLVHSGQDGVI